MKEHAVHWSFFFSLLPVFVESSKLADLIADLDSTAPKDYDPEDVLEPMNDKADQSDANNSDNDYADDSAAREHYVSVGKSKLRNDQPLLDDPRYAGKRTSRKDLFDDNEEEVEDEDENEDEVDDEESDSSSVDQNENDDDGDDDKEVYTDTNEDTNLESSGNDDDDDDDDTAAVDDEEDKDESEVDEQQDDDEVNNELRKIQQEERQMISQLSQSAQADAEKGKHVRQQLTLWDNCLESRIRMQKVVDDANRLPQNDTYYDFLAKSEGVEKDLEVAKTELREIIDDLMDIRSGLFAQHGSVDLTDKELNSRKRHLDDDDDEYLDKLWKDISEMNDVFVPFRNSTLEKWSNKVQAASGARLNKKFKAFDQNIMSQIENAMADKEGLIKRTQLQRSDYKIIGKTAQEATPTPADMDKKPDRHLNNYDVEIFDDHDFYQQQLRELIESRMVDTDDPLAIGMRWAARKQTEQKKKKKDVNRKASKGRQLRFNVHEKLQNFMAPIPVGEWHESMIDELYSSLLGQKMGL
ncbi:apoptosis antagonizing transcription factor-domain-containing protein [Mycotypha africana]|uniref:apoptosis antagonizing transcription factor-domain-containing protein n=1 Tax=Mycotypha africana TaxID=64632 RepID=UPI0023007FBF|nr:apoptosis antagonizing transcription factor-domain-containing protein [Mycotypha africana]KAI8984148.1 apoptosis antagonizing transcription factor-domain-containing protein [Mycotypha africana]